MGEKPAKEKNRSTLVSRNITVLGRRTSVRLEPEMWKALREIAKREQCRVHDICSLVSLRKNSDTSLTAAIRVFLMLYFKAAATENGHAKAGHGNFAAMIHRARVAPEVFDSLQVRLADQDNDGPDDGDIHGIQAAEENQAGVFGNSTL